MAVPPYDESVVAGMYMDRSLGDFARACERYILDEQEKLAPDTWLIAILCDAVRLTREMASREDLWQIHLEQSQET